MDHIDLPEFILFCHHSCRIPIEHYSFLYNFTLSYRMGKYLTSNLIKIKESAAITHLEYAI